jgi:hypothetical protein
MVARHLDLDVLERVCPDEALVAGVEHRLRLRVEIGNRPRPGRERSDRCWRRCLLERVGHSGYKGPKLTESALSDMPPRTFLRRPGAIWLLHGRGQYEVNSLPFLQGSKAS